MNSSPVQMHCRLALEVPLLNNSSTMILLQIDTYVIKGKILRNQSTLYPGKTSIQGNPDVRSITAKIDCLLLRPLSSLGNGRFGCVRSIYHMGRPRPKELSNNEVLDENRRKKRELSNSQKLINSCKPNNTSKTATESTAVTTLDDTTCNNIVGNLVQCGKLMIWCWLLLYHLNMTTIIAIFLKKGMEIQSRIHIG